MTNDKLPEVIQEQINNEADGHAKGLSIEHSKAHQRAGYIAGANDWAPWKVAYDELQDRSEKLRLALVMAVFALKRSYDVSDYPADGQTEQDSAIRIGEEALQRFKDEGKESVVGKCTKCGRHYPHANISGMCGKCEKGVSNG